MCVSIKNYTHMSEQDARHKKLGFAKAVIWLGIALYCGALIVFQFYGMTASNYHHTYFASNPPGTLQSDRLNGNFWFTGSLVLYWLVPITSAFMMAAPAIKGRRDMHLFLVTGLWLYFTVVMGFWAFDYSSANQGTTANAHNQANDDRWCCVHSQVAGPACPTLTAPCAPAVSAGQLNINQVFIWKFWFNVTFLVLLVVDFFMVTFFWTSELNKAGQETTTTTKVPLLPGNGRSR